MGVLLFGLCAPFGLVVYALLIALTTVVGIVACQRAGRLLGNKDDGRMVIDEVAGQLVALLPVAALVGVDPASLGDELAPLGLQWWLLVVTAFVLFRLFDIAKPGPVRWAERRFSGDGLRDGLGVMADDLVAGMLAALCLLPVAYAFVLERLQWVAAIGQAGRASAGMAP